MNLQEPRTDLPPQFNANWVIAARMELRKIAYQIAQLPDGDPSMLSRWPLMPGCRYDAYWAGDGAVALLMHHVEVSIKLSGPAVPSGRPPGLHPLVELITREAVDDWISQFSTRITVGGDDAVIVVPVYDEPTAAEQWDRWTEGEREVWAWQINTIASRHAKRVLVGSTAMSTLYDAGLSLIAREPNLDEHPSFAQPIDARTSVWRYSSMAKLIAVLESRSLWFSRADSLDDPHEGARGPVNIAHAAEMYGDAEHAAAANASNELLRHRAFINCWHASDHESHAMWSIYGPRGETVAIRSTYDRLRQCLGNNSQVSVGLVRYVDYTKTWIPEENAFDALMHKRKSFEHESEARAVFIDFSADGVDKAGRQIPTDLSSLLVEIVVAPEAPGWFAELLQRLVGRLDLEVDVRHSDLDVDPIY